MKRALDIFLSLAMLIVSMPIAALVVVAIRVDSAGPVFFSQLRLGRNGQPIRILKFRKFYHWPRPLGLALTLKEDFRMTPVGKVLERTKLDELPQLWNILAGDMSLVGPRPETFDFADCFQGPYRDVLRYKPGIFGPNQVFFRSERILYPEQIEPVCFYKQVLFPLKARVDLTYFPQATVFQDIVWIARGMLAIFLQLSVADNRDFIERIETWIRRKSGRLAPRNETSPEPGKACAPY